MSRELNSSTAHRRRDLEKRLGNVNGAISKAVDALLGEVPSRALRDRLTALEAQRDEIESAIADVVPPAVEFHPNAANAYRDHIRNQKKLRRSPMKTAVWPPMMLFGRLSRKSSFTHRAATNLCGSTFTANSPPCSGFPRGRPTP